ncbi:serine/threonine-protein kinase [Kitasatospora camelliae]|uniref:non-specific serine/threonine protein kinase n=1 Tax=Kitasatospora camelliae TaxID=3156397 RepID=A0AAU8K3R8_9ACTN
MDDFGGSGRAAVAPGTLLAGRYRLEERLGRGGMGTVWRAVDERMRRPVALKEPSPPAGVDQRSLEEFYRRLEREAQAAARLRHPNVVRVHDIETVDGLPWLVMELIEGESLESWLSAGTATVAEVAAMGRALCGALAEVHAAGVVHRDVKPANIMRTPSGEVVLTDFGIARVEGSTDLTRTGMVVGSVPYLSPERAGGLRPGPADDMWALGLVLYEALEGVHPYRRQSTQGTLLAIVQDPLPAPRRAGALAGPVMALLERDPERRPTAARAAELFVPEPAAEPTPTEPTTPLPPGEPPADTPATVRLRPTAAPAEPAESAEPPAPEPARKGSSWLLPVVAGLAVLAIGGTAGWLVLRPDGAPSPTSVPAGYSGHRVSALGLGIAVPDAFSIRQGVKEVNFASPDNRVQIRIKDEGKAAKSATEYAQERLRAVKAGRGTFCNAKEPDEFHVQVVHEPQSVVHGGDVEAAEIEYAYSTRAEDDYPCLSNPPANEAMEQFMVRDGRVLHLTVRFVRHHGDKAGPDPSADNQKLYGLVDRSLNLG